MFHFTNEMQIMQNIATQFLALNQLTLQCINKSQSKIYNRTLPAHDIFRSHSNYHERERNTEEADEKTCDYYVCKLFARLMTVQVLTKPYQAGQAADICSFVLAI
jgi:hypothetical protein